MPLDKEAAGVNALPAAGSPKPSTPTLQQPSASAPTPLTDITNTNPTTDSTIKKRKVKSDATKLKLKNYAINSNTIDILILAKIMKTYGDDKGLRKFLRRYKFVEDERTNCKVTQNGLDILFAERMQDLEDKSAERAALQAERVELDKEKANYERELEKYYIEAEEKREVHYETWKQRIQDKYALLATGTSGNWDFSDAWLSLRKRTVEVEKREDALKKQKTASAPIFFG